MKIQNEIKVALGYCFLFAMFGFFICLSWIAMKGFNLNELKDLIIIELAMFLIPFPAMYGIACFQEHPEKYKAQKTKKVQCKHELKNRQAVASPTHWGNQLISIICIKCGEVIYSYLIDSNKFTEVAPGEDGTK